MVLKGDVGKRFCGAPIKKYTTGDAVNCEGCRADKLCGPDDKHDVNIYGKNCAELVWEGVWGGGEGGGGG